jgi:hypothetical protein
LFEINKILNNINEISIHKGINVKQNILKESIYHWYGMYEVNYKYVKSCTICTQTHKNNFRKPIIKQIISNKPKERNIVEQCELSKEFITEMSPYICNCDIIEHFSKYC